MKTKQLAAICFAVAFLMAIVLFGGVGRSVISVYMARTIFMVAGIAGMFLNLISFRTDPQDKKNYNFWFWLGSIVVFAGFMAKIMHWPFGFQLILAGMLIIGISFFYTPQIEREENDDDLLDNPKN